MTPIRSLTVSALAATAALLGSGCGDDRPVSGPPPSSGYSAPAPASGPALSAPTSPAPDPLLSGSGTISTRDPLLGHEAPTSGKNAAQADPLLPANPLASDDPLRGQTMPTDHSHWLRGRVQDARLTVLVNGVREGVYTGVVDRDITRTLRRGVNSVSFVYTPRRADASARMDLLESEHDPPIAPLATFQSRPLPREAAISEEAVALKTTTQNITFFAH